MTNAWMIENARANADIIKGYQWLATLDSTTCLRCAARDGLRFTKTFEPIGHSLPWSRGPGKIHRRCRCVCLPVLDSRYDILSRGATRPAVLMGQVEHVPTTTTYNDWLRTKSPAYQEYLIGFGRSVIWRTNNLHLMDLLDDAGRPMKVAALVEKYGAITGIRSGSGL